MSAAVGFGVIGCGYFGAEFARILRGMEGARLAAVCGGGRRDLTPLAAELGCDVEPDAARLMERADVEAVIVANPNHLHKETVIAAAERGKHVFCEKPAALSLRACREMVEACQARGVQLMLGHILHFLPGIEQVKEWIAAGTLGRLVTGHAVRTGWEDVSSEARSGADWKRSRSLSGGQLFHHIHELDLLLSLFGAAEQVFMMADNVAHPETSDGEDDVLLLALRFASGALGTLRYGSCYRWGEHFVALNGTKGAARIDMRASEIELRIEGAAPLRIGLNGDELEDKERAALFRGELGGGVIVGDARMRPPSFLRSPMEREMRVFLNAVNGNPIEARWRELFDGTAALRSVAAAEAAMRSRETGCSRKLAKIEIDN